MPQKTAAIYHFTNGSTKRPKIYRDQLHNLEEFAASYGYTNVDIYCDKTLIKGEQVEFKRFLAVADQYDALFVKDFYHIGKNTGMCFDTMHQLRDKGVMIHSMDNGDFVVDSAPFDKPLRVIGYVCLCRHPKSQDILISIQQDVLQLFVDKKTNWKMVGMYTDVSPHQNDGEQIQLKQLLERERDFDLLLVHNMLDLHWRASKTCKIREKLGVDIYSLQDGYLRYGRRK